MQPVGVPGAPEQAEDHVVLVDEGGDVSGQDHKPEQGGVAPCAQPDDIHDVSGIGRICLKSRVFRAP